MRLTAAVGEAILSSRQGRVSNLPLTLGHMRRTSCYTPLRIKGHSAHGQRRCDKAADVSITALQGQLRGLSWEDMIADLQEQCHKQFVVAELERLRVASQDKKLVNMRTCVCGR